jgi:IclR family transcriptional regulator, pca regulon regulatory protein
MAGEPMAGEPILNGGDTKSRRVSPRAHKDVPEWWPQLREPKYSQSLDRGLAILAYFTPRRQVLGIAEIADALGMSRSTTHRYMTTLVALGYLEQINMRKYRLAPRATNLGMSALSSMRLRDHAHLHLEELRTRTSYTSGIGVLQGTEVLYIDRVHSWRRGEVDASLNLRTGSRVPAYCTAIGKLLLASLPKPERTRLIAAMRLVKHGPNTIARKRALCNELEGIGESLAVDDEEFAPSVYAIAAPVYDENHQSIAAVDIMAHSSTTSLEDLVVACSAHLYVAADQISARLGHRSGDNGPVRL